MGQEQPDFARPVPAAAGTSRWATWSSRSIRPIRPSWPASNAVDFDDLLLHVATLLRDNPEVRAGLDERYRFILVDEYQDTNLAQYAIARALSIDYPNLAVTGDPDQSIYGWRGANLNNILEFERDFPEVHVVRLERNYRSTQRILRVAAELIAHNVRRKEKGLFTENGPGEPVRLVDLSPRRRTRPKGSPPQIAERDPRRPPPAARLRHLLPRQRPEPGVRVRPARGGRALPDGQRPGVLPAQGNQGRSGLSAPVEQSARRSGPAAGHQHAGPRHRQDHHRPAVATTPRGTACRCLEAARAVRAASRRSARGRRPCWREFVALVRSPGGGRRRAGRGTAGPGAERDRLSRRCSRLGRRGGRRAAGQHRGTADRGPRVRRTAAAARANLEAFLEETCLVNDTDAWETRRRSRHADDAARLEGAGVSRGLSRRPSRRGFCRTSAAASIPSNWKRSGG